MQVSLTKHRGQSMTMTFVILGVIVLFSLLPILRLLQEVNCPGGEFSLKAIEAGLEDPVV